MKPLYDIRRTLSPGVGHLEGRDIMDVVKKYADDNKLSYVKKLIKDVDGDKFFEIGLAGRSPAEDMIIRWGDDALNGKLSNTEINPHETYSTIGVGTAAWPGAKTAAMLYENHFTIAIDKIKEGLEQLLS